MNKIMVVKDVWEIHTGKSGTADVPPVSTENWNIKKETSLSTEF